MKISKTSLMGAFTIDAAPHTDERGFFFEGFSKRALEKTRDIVLMSLKSIIHVAINMFFEGYITKLRIHRQNWYGPRLEKSTT